MVPLPIMYKSTEIGARTIAKISIKSQKSKQYNEYLQRKVKNSQVWNDANIREEMERVRS